MCVLGCLPQADLIPLLLQAIIPIPHNASSSLFLRLENHTKARSLLVLTDRLAGRN
jgi:hypothetical protein